MLRTPPGSRSSSPSAITTPVHRFSRRLLGLSPELNPLQERSSEPCLPLPMATASLPQVPRVPQDSSTHSPSQVTLLQPLIPDRFHGGAHEDVEDWLDQYERVAKVNGWTAQQKLSHAYFALDGSARTWFENREASFATWNDFQHQLIETFASVDRRDRAQQLIELRFQKGNETVAMFAEDMARLCRRADPHMPEEKKLRYLMRGIKEELFAGLVRNPPSTVADFIKEATGIERALHLRCRQYDRLPTSTPINSAAMTVTSQNSLHDLIREILREELQKLWTPAVGPPMASVAEIVRDEVMRAFSAGNPVHEQRPLSYADVVRRQPAMTPVTPMLSDVNQL